MPPCHGGGHGFESRPGRQTFFAQVIVLIPGFPHPRICFCFFSAIFSAVFFLVFKACKCSIFAAKICGAPFHLLQIIRFF
ncbi:MAG: hypothetical protein V4628_03185, partial [Pseudomonadota bacterium]